MTRRSGSEVGLERILERGLARAGTGAAPAGGWTDALERIVASANAEGDLTDAGAAAFETKLSELVGERLVAEAHFAREPAIRDRALPIRFVVAGFGRSGTTVLHRLLACDPDVEFLPTWQAFRPTPPLQGADTRRDDVVALVERMRESNPDAFRIHPLDADAPEEEVFLLQLSFASMLFMLPCPLPGYTEWLNTTYHREAYEFAFDMLRLNEHAAGTPDGRPRVMKSPQFVLDLQVVTDLAPNAVFIQNHRDPVDLVGSYCSTYAASRRGSCASVDLHALGRERLGQLAALSARALAVRRRAEADPSSTVTFVDVTYGRLVTEPLAVVEEIYETAGIPFTVATRRSVAEWIAAHPQHAGGAHRYDLADYGLDRAKVDAALSDYIERFSPGVE